MGLRRGEINGVKYSDVDYKNHTLTIERQLGIAKGSDKAKLPPKTYTKQEIRPKTESSCRVLPIPDVVFDAILEQRKIYESNRSRRKQGKYVFRIWILYVAQAMADPGVRIIIGSIIRRCYRKPIS